MLQLSYESRSLAMNLVGEVCEGDQNFITVIEFFCNTTNSKLDQVLSTSIEHVNPKIRYVTLTSVLS